MTSHSPFLELAAAAIDFRLSPSEHRDLEHHLAGCHACARTIAAIRGDATAMAHLPPVVLPERRGLEILDSVLHPAAARHTVRLVLIAALLTLLVLASLAVGAELVRRADENRLAVVPVLTPSALPDASASAEIALPGPSVAADPPDGLIAYTGVEGGQRVVRTVHPDGSAARTVARGESPAWSPDGTMLAFRCPPSSPPADPIPGSDVCIANADGSRLRVVVSGATSPSWSPDGARLMFARSVIDAGDAWVVDVDGSNVRRLGDGTGSWSPSGEWILLLGASGAEPDATIIHPDGTDARQLGRCEGAAWSPDGTMLACTGVQGTDGELRTIGVADGAPTMTFSEHARVDHPTWLAKDRIVVVLTGTGSPEVADGAHLYLVDFGMHQERVLLDQTANVTSVAPGGDWIAVDVGTTDIHLVSVDGRERTLTSDGTSMGARWQPRLATAGPSPSPTASAPFSTIVPGSIRVGSEDVAWVSTATRLYRTADGGTRWMDVPAPGPYVPALGVAPDADTLFLVAPEPVATVWVTRDSGRSWAEVPFPREDGSTPPTLTFATPSHGFARFQQDASPVRIYETADGGRTWTGPVVRDTPEAGMPYGGMPWLPRREKGVIWSSNGKADNQPFDDRLMISEDGGATWQEGRFPTGPGAPKDELKSVDGLWADGTGRVVLVMSLGDGQRLYSSEDGGRSWQFLRSWPSFLSGNTTIDHQVALLTGDEWILVAKDGSGSWSTQNGGADWRQVTGTPTALLDEIYVASPDRFLAIHRCDVRRTVTGTPDPACEGGMHTILLITSDGGRTWTQAAA